MTDNIAISVKNVSKDFKLPHERVDSVKSLFTQPFRKRVGNTTQHALKDITFEVKKGEFFGIVGRNGSGKSTLLKIIAGIYQPTKGSVQVSGRLVPFIELGVGFNPELSGRENVYLNGALMGFSQKEIKAKYPSIVEFAELEQFMDQKLKNYSSGMQVRLAFSVATILAESDILLIDEVLAVGDADFQRKCFRYFNQLKAKGRSVIFISHDMDAIERFCDRAMMIDESKVVKIGKANEIAKRYYKLFSQSTVAQDSSRLGTGEMRIEDVSIEATAKKITIKASAIAHGDFDAPIFGVSINSEDSTKIAGSNTKIEQISVPSMAAGEKIDFEWSMDNIFATGRYSIDLTIHSNDLTSVYDWWQNAKYFENDKPLTQSFYHIDVPFHFTQVKNERVKR